MSIDSAAPPTSTPAGNPPPGLPGYDDPEARAGLRRMKAVAGGILAAAAGLFLLTFALPDTTATGYLRAAAEAGMVGGLADWFAVTALFRHPMRLKIPHTALVPRKKDELATKLGEFVAGYFVTPDAVARQVAEANLVRRVGEALADPVRADRVAAEVSTALAAALRSTDPQEASDWVMDTLARDLSRREREHRSWAPKLGPFLRAAVEGNGQQPVLDLVVRHARDYLVTHREAVHDSVYMFLENRSRISALLATHRSVDWLLDFVRDTLDEMLDVGRTHPIRRRLDDLLLRFADDLVNDPKSARAVDAQLRLLVHDPRIGAAMADLVSSALDSLRDSLAEGPGSDGPSKAQARLATMVRDLGDRMCSDEAFAARLNSVLEQAVRYGVTHYGDNVVALIRTQVQAWDGRAASDRIETAVGRDLQFIRINGTVVGALAGVAIHTVAVAAGKG
ncbi:MAG: DUF445 domain-containing protein [Sporichthyaceae bacterium]